jgi:hypothetical protein
LNGSQTSLITADGTARFAGKVLVGLSESTGNNCSLQIAAPSAAAAEFYTSRTDFYGPYLRLSKSRGTSGSEADVNIGDELGTITFQGYHAGSYRLGAQIASIVEGSFDGNSTPSRISFGTGDRSTNGIVQRMRLDSLGRLIIGNLPPDDSRNYRLWVGASAPLICVAGNSSGYTEGAFLSSSPNSSRGGGIFMHNAGPSGNGPSFQWFAGNPYSIGDQYIIARTSGTNLNDLSTAQGVNALLTLAPNGNLTITGNLIESGSDDKLKTNRTQLTSALQKVETLEGFTFNWNEDAINNYGFSEDEKTLVGLSAQEMQLVLPEAVKVVTTNGSVSDPTSGEPGEKREYLTIQYDRVVPLLVEAIKELSTKNAELTSQLAKIESFEQRLADAGL